MHLSAFQITTAIASLATIAALAWIVRIVLRKQENTRERFAFAALTVFTTMATGVLTALKDKQTLWGEITTLIRQIFHMEVQADPPHVEDHLLMLAVIIIVAYFILRLYDNWSGAVSIRQYDKQRYHEPSPLLVEGMYEARRIIQRQPALQLAPSVDGPQFSSVIKLSGYSLVWHLEVRDLICLRSPAYDIHRVDGWHDQVHCWIGRNKKTGGLVAVKCADEEPPLQALADFMAYVRRCGKRTDTESIEYILATRKSISPAAIIIDGVTIRREDERTLIEELVDFSDYFADIKHRVERQPLPDSAITLKQIYVGPRCSDEHGRKQIEFDGYITSWLAEPGQRQLALLGEYGQGKSTSAMMAAYRLITDPTKPDRIPILIPLRGKSPRNMVPEDIISSWAYAYHINPQSVMKMLIAGKIWLILVLLGHK